MCSIPGAMNSDLNSDSVFAVCAHAGVIEGSSRKKMINRGDQRRIDEAIISSRSKLRRSAWFRTRMPVLPFRSKRGAWRRTSRDYMRLLTISINILRLTRPEGLLDTPQTGTYHACFRTGRNYCLVYVRVAFGQTEADAQEPARRRRPDQRARRRGAARDPAGATGS